MVTIGRRGGTKVYIPNSRNTMAERAARQLEAHAKAQGEKYSNALQVDAPSFYFWHDHGGSIPCSCMSKKRFKYPQPINPGEMEEENSVTILPETKNKSVTGYRTLGRTRRSGTETFKETVVDKLTNRNELKFEKGDYFDEGSITQALTNDSTNDSNFDPDDPFGIFNRKMITCSICMGSGAIDAWQPDGGVRIVFDTSPAYKFVTNGPDVDASAQPSIISFKGDKDNAVWLYSMPLVWDDILRTNVYNNEELIPESMYEWTWITADKSQQGSVNDDLDQLQNYGGPVYFQLRSLEDFEMTHCEIILGYAPPKKAQLPEVERAYEDEFTDYQATVSAEMPIGLNIKEGDYVTDSKYRRVWKINTINRRTTAGGNEFGVAVELRALMPFEKRFYQLALFGSSSDGRIQQQKLV